MRGLAATAQQASLRIPQQVCEVENHHVFHMEKIHDFDWGMFNSYMLKYQMLFIDKWMI